jgi:hypothetical protein
VYSTGLAINLVFTTLSLVAVVWMLFPSHATLLLAQE